MKKKKVRRVALLVLFLASVGWYLEGPGTHAPGWWKISTYCPLASGPVRWRLVAPVMKLAGSLPELGWGELWSYFKNVSGDGDQRGFVTLVRHTDEAPCSTLWATPFGELWGRPTDGDLVEFLVIEQLIERIYDNRTIRVGDGDVVIDVGGHLGVFTLFALAKGARQVVVVEPEPTNLICLKKTLAGEIRDRKVLLVEAAAWDSRDVLTFDIPPEGNTGMGRVGDAGTIEVPAVTIDDVVAELGLDAVNFIKMDIEGAERKALTGARGTLERFGPRLSLCTYHDEDDEEALSKIALEARPQYRTKTGRHHAYFY